MKEVKWCPCCGFTKEKFKIHKKKVGGNCEWEHYMPHIFLDPIFNKWFIECQNCGMRVTWLHGEEETISHWIMLPRKETTK